MCSRGQPYCDTPLDNETVGENVYLNIINRAKKYVYIFTPYLISDNEVITALCLAAKSGIDVRIVTPGIPDKKMVFLLTQSYYGTLLQAGVRIFEYKPGFLHAKSFVCDDEIATVGTINLDYRSLYLAVPVRGRAADQGGCTLYFWTVSGNSVGGLGEPQPADPIFPVGSASVCPASVNPNIITAV